MIGDISDAKALGPRSYQSYGKVSHRYDKRSCASVSTSQHRRLDVFRALLRGGVIRHLLVYSVVQVCY